jgi:hypothetical protein
VKRKTDKHRKNQTDVFKKSRSKPEIKTEEDKIKTMLDFLLRRSTFAGF